MAGTPGPLGPPPRPAGGTTLFIADERRDIRLYDVTDALAPRPLGTIATPVAATVLRPQDGALLIGLGYDGTMFWDVRNPARPRLVRHWGTLPGARTLEFAGDLVYGEDSSRGLFAIDLCP